MHRAHARRRARTSYTQHCTRSAVRQKQIKSGLSRSGSARFAAYPQYVCERRRTHIVQVVQVLALVALKGKRVIQWRKGCRQLNRRRLAGKGLGVVVVVVRQRSAFARALRHGSRCFSITAGGSKAAAKRAGSSGAFLEPSQRSVLRRVLASQQQQQKNPASCFSVVTHAGSSGRPPPFPRDGNPYTARTRQAISQTDDQT